jgi:hypothetical protein
VSASSSGPRIGHNWTRLTIFLPDYTPDESLACAESLRDIRFLFNDGVSYSYSLSDVSDIITTQRCIVVVDINDRSTSSKFRLDTALLNLYLLRNYKNNGCNAEEIWITSHSIERRSFGLNSVIPTISALKSALKL